MDKKNFGILFFNSLDTAANLAEDRLGNKVAHSFEIELHGAGHSGVILSPEHALDALYINENQFYRIIDISVIEINPTSTRVFVRVSAHTPSAFEETWNQPAGSGPFKQIQVEKIKVNDKS